MAADTQYLHVTVLYRRASGQLVLQLPVFVPVGVDWQQRARRVAHIVGEINLQLYDLEPKET